jgi:hypothetical protein
MSYEKFDNRHRKQKYLILMWSCLTILCLVLIITINMAKDNYLVFKSAPVLDSSLLKEDICFNGFNSIVRKGAISSLVIDSYIKALKKLNYQMIDFDISKDSYRLIKLLNNEQCKIILRDLNTQGHGLRSFVVKLRKNDDFEFEYKVSGIFEVLLEENDLQGGL